MTTIADLCDRRRTVAAVRIGRLVHRIQQETGNFQFITGCHELVHKKDLLLFLQRPEDISCNECQEGYYHGH
jgi:hypothetical protein